MPCFADRVRKPVQPKSEGSTPVFTRRHISIAAPTAAPLSLPEPLRSGAEALGGFSLADVKVHHNSPVPAKLGALAFARGSDIHLGPGQQRHLPHEAWHVVQQKRDGAAPSIQLKTAGASPHDAREQEAVSFAQQQPTLHEIGEPAATYLAAIWYDDPQQLPPTPNLSGKHRSDLPKEMEKILASEYGWKQTIKSGKIFKFANDSVTAGGPWEGPYVGSGPAGEPEKTLEAAYAKAVQTFMDKQAAEDAARKVKKSKGSGKKD